MLEKSSSIILTSDDIKMYNDGLVSKRLQETWGLDITSLGQLINSQNYTLANKDEQH